MSHHSGAVVGGSGGGGGGGGVVSRSGSPYPMQSQRGGGKSDSGTHISCNQCRKALSTTIFVCSCDCVFCEECTYSHFNSSSTCPVCRKLLGANDFMELVVADPSSATEESLKNTFQTMFTKYSSSSNVLSHQEMCSRLLKSFDDDRRTVRFLLKQFVLESKTTGRQSGSIERAYEELKAEYTHMKQAASSQRIQTEQVIADLRHRVQALTGTVQEQLKKIDEKDKQINQFRRMYAADGMGQVPGSSHSNGSGGRRNSPYGTGSHERMEPLAPPMPGFVIRKQAQEQAKEQALQEISRSRGPPNLIGENRNGHQTLNKYVSNLSDMNSVVTPIQVPPPNQYLQNRQSPGIQNRQSPGGIPATPRIRDLSANSSYTFTSSSNRNSFKRLRTSSTSPGPHIQPGYGRSMEQQRPMGGFASR